MVELNDYFNYQIEFSSLLCISKGPNIDHVLNTFNKNFNQLFRDLLDRLNYYEKREAELSMINVIARLDHGHIEIWLHAT